MPTVQKFVMKIFYIYIYICMYCSQKSVALLGFFQGRGQISITGHMHFHNFIQYHAKLVKCYFFPSSSWYKIYFSKSSKTPAEECYFKSTSLLKITLFLRCFLASFKKASFIGPQSMSQIMLKPSKIIMEYRLEIYSKLE